MLQTLIAFVSYCNMLAMSSRPFKHQWRSIFNEQKLHMLLQPSLLDKYVLRDTGLS